MATVLITGGTGLIGKPLSRMLVEKGYDVITVTRNASGKEQRLHSGVSYATWNVGGQTIDASAIAKADHIIHLAGANVAGKRWTAARKKEIVDSRVLGSTLLVKALTEIPNNVKTVVSASAIGWYGADPQVPNPKPFVETDAASDGFLGNTCRLWEESIQPVTALKKRLVKLRTGIALSNEGGAFAEFIKPVRLGVAAILGTGKQIISWIHIDDLCRMYLEAIENEAMWGTYNAVAPRPVSNKQLTVQIAKGLKGNFYIPMYVPSFGLRLVLGKMSEEVLKSATVSCEKIRKSGFNFIYPSIESAVGELLKK